jgi:hypothetical protein
MIRNILITALFFFGPAILMFVLRNVFLIVRLWWRVRALRQTQEADVIDITPAKRTPPGRLFIISSLLVGAACAALVWFEMSDAPVQPGEYIPAHINSEGELVPGRMVPAEPATPDQR